VLNHYGRPTYVKPGLIWHIQRIHAPDPKPFRPRMYLQTVHDPQHTTVYTWPAPSVAMVQHNAARDAAVRFRDARRAMRRKIGAALVAAFLALRKMLASV